ncbi:MAG: C1 family peptidase [Fibromonadaceae bacterium]|jgi:hypothetical protein|nr:C1 family peptidase [Fibromonadaceae bacterium]
MKKYAFLLLVFALLGCGKHSPFDDIFEELLGELSTGWLPDKDNISTIPQDIASFAGDISAAPSNVSLEDKFPPIKSQGSFGTCVAWAVGYNLKTALNGMDNNWSKQDLANTGNQTSPKDVWMTLPAGKSSTCNGTGFETAMDALVSKGAASLYEVPYDMSGSCSGTSNGKPGNKLANYRKIAYDESVYYVNGGSKKEGLTVDNFKGYLSQGRPVVIGARLGDRFKKWNSGNIIASDTYNEPNSQHSYHAMVLSGYDDSKQAFRVRNSWGENWGDKGSIWVDYDFFLKSFCFVAFVAQNPASAPPQDNKQLASGYDLLTSDANDYPDIEKPNDPRARAFYYDVYNNGSKPILASQRWSVLYLYYNAYDANEFGIIFEDYYTNQYGKLGDRGKYTSAMALADKKDPALAGGYWNYEDVQPGKKAGEAEYGENGFEIDYIMPERVDGDYYLVAFADAYEDIDESNEDNNFYFITAANGKPLKFKKGVLQSTIAHAASAAAESNVLAKKAGRAAAAAASVMELGELNGYTPQEVKSLIKRSKKNGTLAKKVAEFRSEGSTAVKKPRKR